jgi:hypothetical protein
LITTNEKLYININNMTIFSRYTVIYDAKMTGVATRNVARAARALLIARKNMTNRAIDTRKEPYKCLIRAEHRFVSACSLVMAGHEYKFVELCKYSNYLAELQLPNGFSQHDRDELTKESNIIMMYKRLFGGRVPPPSSWAWPFSDYGEALTYVEQKLAPTRFPPARSLLQARSYLDRNHAEILKELKTAQRTEAKRNRANEKSKVVLPGPLAYWRDGGTGIAGEVVAATVAAVATPSAPPAALRVQAASLNKQASALCEQARVALVAAEQRAEQRAAFFAGAQAKTLCEQARVAKAVTFQMSGNTRPQVQNEMPDAVRLDPSGCYTPYTHHNIPVITG